MAEEADVVVSDNKMLKLKANISPNEPWQVPSVGMSSTELTTTIEDNTTIVEAEPDQSQPPSDRALRQPSIKTNRGSQIPFSEKCLHIFIAGRSCAGGPYVKTCLLLSNPHTRNHANEPH